MKFKVKTKLFSCQKRRKKLRKVKKKLLCKILPKEQRRDSIKDDDTKS